MDHRWLRADRLMQMPVTLSQLSAAQFHQCVLFRTAESTASALATLSTGAERRGRLGLGGLLQGGGHGVLRHVQVLAQVLDSLVGQGVVQVLPGIREREIRDADARQGGIVSKARGGWTAAGPSGSGYRSEPIFRLPPLRRIIALVSSVMCSHQLNFSLTTSRERRDCISLHTCRLGTSI